MTTHPNPAPPHWVLNAIGWGVYAVIAGLALWVGLS